jgi:predicted nucleic acid-binding protein
LSLARWLVDTSALSRLDRPEVVKTLVPYIGAGLAGVSIVTELELGYSARSIADYRDARGTIVNRMIPVSIPRRAELRAREIQAALIERGQHRSAGLADLLVAATAEVEGLTVLHFDADFDLIAEITGQACEWVIPEGTV